MEDRAARWLPTVLVTTAFAWVVAIAAAPIHDPDSWWHLRLGDELIAQHSLGTPAWSSFASASWVPTEPVPEILSAYVEKVSGLPGLAVLFGLALLLMVLSVHLTNRREAAPVPASVATLLVVPAATLSLTPRPQLASFILLPIVLGAWLQTERDLKPRWWLVPVVWAWSWCHGFWIFGVVVGVVVVVGVAVSRRADLRCLGRLAAVVVGSLAVVAINPAGLGVLKAPFVTRASRQYVLEWQRTDLLMGAPLVTVLMIVTTVVVWSVTRRNVTWARVGLLLLCVVLLWYANRLVVLSGLIASPLLAHALDGLRTERPRSAPAATRLGRAERLSLVAAGAVAAGLLIVLAPATSKEPGGVPVALDPLLDRWPAGTPVFNAYVLGGWLAWRHPGLDQYIDGSITPYSEEQVRDYVRADATEPGWYRVVRRSGAPVALLAADGSLARALQERGWTESGAADGYVLLVAPGRRP